MATIPLPGPIPIPIPIPGTGVGGGDKTVSALAAIRAAGFTGTTREGEPADRAALAIMHLESGGQEDVVNDQPCSDKGDHAVGLMQICCPMHMPVADAKKGMKNLRKAHELYVAAGNSFAGDWPTWHPGGWRTARDMTIHLSGATGPLEAVANAADDIAGGVVDKALGPVDEIASAILSPDTWFRVSKGLLGGWLIIVGTGVIVFIAAKPLIKGAAKVTKTGNLAVNTAQKAANLAS